MRNALVLSGFLALTFISAALANNVVVTLPTKTVTVYRVEIGFQNAKMTAPKTILKASRGFQSVGVLLGDSVQFNAVITPARIMPHFPDTDFAWSGDASGSGAAITMPFSRIGPRVENLLVRGKINTPALATVASVDPPTEVQWCLLNPVSCLTVDSDANEASNWASNNQTSLGGGIHNGPADAARHTYWNAIMIQDGLSADTALGASSAHEYTGIQSGDPHNETVMDLTNNRNGANIGQGLPAGSARSAADAAVRAALAAGTLTILDDITNTNEVGLLEPSNKPFQ